MANWRKTAQGVLLNTPIREYETAKPVQLFFAKYHTKEKLPIIAIKATTVSYDKEKHQFFRVFQGTIFMNPAEFGQFVDALKGLI